MYSRLSVLTPNKSCLLLCYFLFTFRQRSSHNKPFTISWDKPFCSLLISVRCVAFHYTADDTILRLSSNFSPPRFGFFTDNKRQSIRTRSASSALHVRWYKALYLRKWRDVNLLSDRVSYVSFETTNSLKAFIKFYFAVEDKRLRSPYNRPPRG
jgi:hypothetical protein